MQPRASAPQPAATGGTFAATAMSYAAAALLTNLLACLACLPLLVVLLTTDPRQSWPLLVLLVPPCGPALSGVFTVCGLVGTPAGPEGMRSIVLSFVSGWRSGWRRCFGVAALATALATIAAVDFVFVSTRDIGLLLGPVLLLIVALAVVGGVHALAIQSLRPDLRLGAVLRLTMAVAARRPVLMVVSLVALATQLALFVQFPALALGISASLVAYLCWSHVRAVVAFPNERPHPREVQQ